MATPTPAPGAAARLSISNSYDSLGETMREFCGTQLCSVVLRRAKLQRGPWQVIEITTLNLPGRHS